MMRKTIMHAAAITLLVGFVVLALGSAGSTPSSKSSGASSNSVPANNPLSVSLPLANPQNYLLYPAVGAAFTKLKGTLRIDEEVLDEDLIDLRQIDTLGNQFTISGCVAATGFMKLVTYDIKIAYKDDKLTFEFTDVKEYLEGVVIYSDSEIDKVPAFDTKKIADQLKAQIEQVLASANTYGEAKKAFLANNVFLHRAFRPVTSMLRDEFTEALFKDGELSLSAKVSDIRQNENAEFANYTTEIRASLNSNNTITGLFAFVFLYTSDSNLARLKSGENIMLSGQLVRIDYSNLHPRFLMTK